MTGSELNILGVLISDLSTIMIQSLSLQKMFPVSRGSELDLYTVRIGSSTCLTKQIAAEVRNNKTCQTLTRNERRIGASIKKIRQRYMIRHAYAKWKKVVEK